MTTGFECERDSPCRAFIITRLNDKGERIAVAFNGHPGHPGEPILELMLPDSTIEYIVEVLGNNKVIVVENAGRQFK